MKIRIAIAGYGNLGRGVECAVTRNEDMELVGVFTRRAPRFSQDRHRGPCVPHGPGAGHGPGHRRAGALRRQRQRPAHPDPGAGPVLQRGGQLRHPRQNPRALRRGGRRRQEEREAGGDLHRLGPGPVLSQPAVRSGGAPQRPGLHLLGQGREPGPLRRHSPGARGQGRPAVHHPGRGRHGGRALRRPA